MPEGRVVNANGTLKPEYVIADQQGNARFSFQDNGSGAPVIIQENSYYAFGAVMPNSLVSTPTVSNPNLYNGGSEWQNTFQNLPDYYQTGSRNYDPELGRFIAVDPMAESSISLSNYHYANNNPIMKNDPTGNDPDVEGSGEEYPDPNQDDPTGTGSGSGDYPDGTGSGSGNGSSPAKKNPAPQIYNGGGAGDPATNYSTDAVPNTSTAYGGTYNIAGGDPLPLLSPFSLSSGIDWNEIAQMLGNTIPMGIPLPIDKSFHELEKALGITLTNYNKSGRSVTGGGVLLETATKVAGYYQFAQVVTSTDYGTYYDGDGRSQDPQFYFSDAEEQATLADKDDKYFLKNKGYKGAFLDEPHRNAEELKKIYEKKHTDVFSWHATLYFYYNGFIVGMATYGFDISIDGTFTPSPLKGYLFKYSLIGQ
jgi:RHS repeat-associated protein